MQWPNAVNPLFSIQWNSSCFSCSCCLVVLRRSRSCAWRRASLTGRQRSPACSWKVSAAPTYVTPPLPDHYLLCKGWESPGTMIRFRFRGQRFDSKTIIDATIFLMYIYMHDFQKYIYTSEFATRFANHFLLLWWPFKTINRWITLANILYSIKFPQAERSFLQQVNRMLQQANTLN